MKTRIEKIKSDVVEIRASVAKRKNDIEVCKASVEKYQAQLDNVRNNREYDTLSKEIEY